MPRYKQDNEDRLTISTPTDEDPTLVVCPQCGGMAKVFPFGEQPQIGYSMRVVCTKCSYAKTKTDTSQTYYWSEEDPTDSYFEYPLYLKMRCCSSSLWVFNRRHLEFLEQFVSAGLRERRQGEHGWSNSALASRLPKWLQSAKNRKPVMACLAKLRELGCYSV